MTGGREGVDIEYEGIASGGDGGVTSGYLAKPASGVGCGIVVIHDEWGLTEFIRDVCDRLARAGFVALAPDLFRGRIAEDSISAEQFSKEFELDGADAELESAVAELYNQNATAGSKVGALGFGLGGSLALFLSSRHRRIGAVDLRCRHDHRGNLLLLCFRHRRSRHPLQSCRRHHRQPQRFLRRRIHRRGRVLPMPVGD